MTSLTAYPNCPRCGCAAFKIDAAELAAAEANDALEQAYYPNGRILDTDMAAGMAAAVGGLEANISARGWDLLPQVGVIHLTAALDSNGERVAVDSEGDTAYLMGFMTVGLDLRYAGLLEMSRGNPNVFVRLLADMAEHAAEKFAAYTAVAGQLDPDDPVIGWWLTWEGYVRHADADMSQSAQGRPELVRDEIRSLVCIDVDERVHEVNRLRHAGTVTQSAEPWPLFESRLAGTSPDPVGSLLAPAGLPAMIEGLLRLVRCSRVQAMTNGELRSAAKNVEGLA